jgi:hypothetical protein
MNEIAGLALTVAIHMHIPAFLQVLSPETRFTLHHERLERGPGKLIDCRHGTLKSHTPESSTLDPKPLKSHTPQVPSLMHSLALKRKGLVCKSHLPL